MYTLSALHQSVRGWPLLLQGLSTDVRPEVRNSAVRTLCAVVAGQGGRMSAPAWEECLWQMLFPLLRSVHHLAATSSKEEVRPVHPSLQGLLPRSKRLFLPGAWKMSYRDEGS